ncbi:uncharacterized protein LOC110636677 isoform X1 [Hevea brasiliensis]|uniref:uncharacterized protein LOC110636677 isoform X1 n=1 Tax=Hevea brasiliensis TaxID=3981 RepID=UPI0025EA02BB|nr:uncharacterized protein LOC110636677 isoform X1 [Hevea brasiliensis]
MGMEEKYPNLRRYFGIKRCYSALLLFLLCLREHARGTDMGLPSATTASFSFSTTISAAAARAAAAATKPRSFLYRGLYFLSTSSSPLLPSPVRPLSLSKFNWRKRSLYPWRSSIDNVANRVSCNLLKVDDDINDEACELVNGVALSIGEGVDSIHAYLFKAVKNNNGTGILLLSDIFGFEDSSTRDFAYRVACNGYNVLVPDLFRGDPWAKDRPMTMFEYWLAKQEPQRVAMDIATAAKWMADEFLAVGISKKLGIIGFCFGGGRLIEVLSRDQGACFGVGVSFYGTRMDPSVASNVKVPVLFISGDNDPLCSVNVSKDIEKRIGHGSRVIVFQERGHGFAHRPNSPEEDRDAEQAFVLMRNWLHDGLVLEE